MTNDINSAEYSSLFAAFMETGDRTAISDNRLIDTGDLVRVPQALQDAYKGSAGIASAYTGDLFISPTPYPTGIWRKAQHMQSLAEISNDVYNKNLRSFWVLMVGAGDALYLAYQVSRPLILDAMTHRDPKMPVGTFAKGDYSIVCYKCGLTVQGADKRAISCFPCAVDSLNEFAANHRDVAGLNPFATVKVSQDQIDTSIKDYFDKKYLLNGVHRYKKFGVFTVKPTMAGQKVVTSIDGVTETQNTTKEGDVIVVGIRGETYVLSRKALEERYTFVSKHVESDDEEWEASGTCFAVRYDGVELKFTAPWGELTLIRAGDMLATVALDNIKLYRIERKAFDETYRLM
jgi:hypothetical protein